MENYALLFGLAAVYAAVLWWGARHLPGERWQIAAAIPVRKDGAGEWTGVNITFYGIITASALAVSSGLLLLLLGALGVPSLDVVLFMAPLISACLPASRLVARWVESKPATLTIGGAAFVGLLLAPWLVGLLRAGLGLDALPGFQVTPVLAALMLCYALGEGLGRLACLSFGCCYGRPLEQCPAWLRRLLGRRGLVFSGATKKIAYEAGLAGLPVLPVQVITSAVYGLASLGGLHLFLSGRYQASLWLTLAVSGLWRAYSETLRADFRGHRRFTAYQALALAGVAYGVVVSLVMPPVAAPIPQLGLGWGELWSPGALCALMLLWVAALINSGVSRVTGARISFHLNRNQI